MMTVRELVSQAYRLIGQVHHDLCPMGGVQPPAWRFYVHPETLTYLAMMVDGEHLHIDYTVTDELVATGVRRVGPAVEYLAHNERVGTLRLFGMLVLPDDLISTGELELRYTQRETLPVASFAPDEYTGDKRSHP